MDRWERSLPSWQPETKKVETGGSWERKPSPQSKTTRLNLSGEFIRERKSSFSDRPTHNSPVLVFSRVRSTKVGPPGDDEGHDDRGGGEICKWPSGEFQPRHVCIPLAWFLFTSACPYRSSSSICRRRRRPPLQSFAFPCGVTTTLLFAGSTPQKSSPLPPLPWAHPSGAPVGSVARFSFRIIPSWIRSDYRAHSRFIFHFQHRQNNMKMRRRLTRHLKGIIFLMEVHSF